MGQVYLGVSPSGNPGGTLLAAGGVYSNSVHLWNTSTDSLVTAGRAGAR